MNRRSRFTALWTLAALIVAATVALLVVILVRPGAETLPEIGSQTYQEMVSAFFSGVAALDADANQIAKPSLIRATELVPNEPAAWANLGLLAIREGDLDDAEEALEKARSLAPDRGEIERFLALLESRRGHFAESIAHRKRAIQLDSNDLKSRFELARELERQGGPEGTTEALRSIEEILKVQPLNLAALLEHARLAAKADDVESLRDTLARLGPQSTSWPPNVQARYQVLTRTANDGNSRLAASQTLALRNVLVTVPAFRQSLDVVQIPIGTIGAPLEYFIKLKNPIPTPSPADSGLSYAVAPLESATEKTRWSSIFAVPQGKTGPPVLWVADGQTMRQLGQSGTELPFPGGPDSTPTAPESFAVADWNSDYALDLVCAGAGGVRFFQQMSDGSFTAVSASTGLGPEALTADATGVWAADLELDGDLDFVVGMRTGPTIVLQNQ
ncbi:MAG: FG-GAP-like repeat-containing protein, partial [Isosphaeraceae bacterium]